MKKAQITAFIIIGIIIMVVGIILVMVYNTNRIRLQVSDSQESSIDPYIRSCMQQHAEDGIYMMGIYSGYLEPPTRNNIPTLEYSKQILEDYLNQKVSNCTGEYPNYGKININLKLPKTVVKFGDKTFITIEEAYSYEKDNQVIQSAPIDLTLNVNYRQMHSKVNNIINEYDGYIHDSESLKTENYDIEVAQQENNLLFLITDHSSEIYFGPFYFAFILD